ncbi:uncharacterized protein LOC128892680 isoform X1 [Hylaeus anthracinus]|uniref:uncharacterized protein LOC128892679 isoform X1 n=1 Tax=Hylaeus anthracinus TaxID=313031 RepID=UPI0023B89B52|nr:uncharacterized protein LOC128892679 isoform X1 [Hylaeus anthracinus]XP_054009197.1 uncharacterized protein LOC128892680 isoform X1 [Hylaeus anthracinus]
MYAGALGIRIHCSKCAMCAAVEEPLRDSGVGICSGLREVRIQIPTAVKKGESAILNCWYDTEGDPLYAVKWYKGGREFYRYAPNETPVVKTFPIGNLTVKKPESNATQVSLTNLELNAAGEYSCEVSADAPSFHTAIVSATMNVVGKGNGVY